MLVFQSLLEGLFISSKFLIGYMCPVLCGTLSFSPFWRDCLFLALNLRWFEWVNTILGFSPFWRDCLFLASHQLW